MSKIEMNTIADVELVLKTITEHQTRFIEIKIAKQTEQDRVDSFFEPQLAEEIRMLRALHEALEEQVPALVKKKVLSRISRLANGTITLKTSHSLVCPGDIIDRLKSVYPEEAKEVIKTTEDINKHALKIWPLKKLRSLGCEIQEGNNVSIKTRIKDIIK